MKKYVSIVLCMVLLLSCNVLSIFASGIAVDGVLTYPEENGRTYNNPVVRYTCIIDPDVEELVVPDFVQSISDNIFCDGESLEEIELSENLQSIGKDAFSETEYYKSSKNWQEGVLYIDDCLIKADPEVIGQEYVVRPGTRLIADGAFEDCAKLEKVTMPASIEFVGEAAFKGTALYQNEKNWENGLLYIGNVLVAADEETVDGEVKIKEGTICVANGAFSSCHGMTSVVCPKSLLYVGKSAFWDCSSLVDVSIGSNVIELGYNAFGMCNALETFKVDERNNYYTVQDGILYNKDMTRLIRCPQKIGGNIVLPASVVEIGEYAFSFCEELKSVQIPESCLFIGEGGFAYCYELREAILPPNLEYIGWWAFTCCHELEEMVVGDSVYELSPYTFQYCTGLTSVSLGENVRVVEKMLFEDCESLKSVELGPQIDEIAHDAFWGTGYVSNVNNYKDGMLIASDKYLISVAADIEECRIPEMVTYIAEDAFEQPIRKDNLRKIFVHSGVKEFSSSAFNESDVKVKIYYDGYYDKFWDISGVYMDDVELYTWDYYRILIVSVVTCLLLLGTVVATFVYDKKVLKASENSSDNATV